MVNNSVSKRVSLNGVFLALTIVVIFTATVLPTSRLALYALSSFFVAVIIIEFGVKAGWIFYIASCILTIIIIPDKLGLLPYLFFFGIFGILKFHIEKINNLLIEYVLKVVFFNICLTLGFYLIKGILLKNINLKIPFWVLIAGLEVVFIIYDYVYTLIIQYYLQKLKKILKI